jgi:hypothetical protein
MYIVEEEIGGDSEDDMEMKGLVKKNADGGK